MPQTPKRPILLYDHSGTYINVAVGVVDQCRKSLLGQHQRIEHCLGQLTDEQVWHRPGPGLNSIGILLCHLRGNVGQWIVHPLGGEAFDRDREAEFAANGESHSGRARGELADMVSRATAVLARLRDGSPTDLEKTLLSPLKIQGIETTGLGAMLHSTGHFEGHAQEVVALTRQAVGDRYQGLFAL